MNVLTLLGSRAVLTFLIVMLLYSPVGILDLRKENKISAPYRYKQ